MRIAIGCDHRGLDVKQLITKMLNSLGHTVKDCGTYTEDAIDYPDIAKLVAQAVTGGEVDHGILICNTGIGMSMAANKVKGVRAALCCNNFMARRARQHNDANILCLGTEMEPDIVAGIIESYLAAEFEGGRHARRVGKIMALGD